MPNFDGTGPRGQGALTGGGRGYCVMPSGDVLRPQGSKVYGARGGGRGNRNCFYATGLPGWLRAQKGMPLGFAQGRQAFGGAGRSYSSDEELAALKNRADNLKNELDTVNARVHELESK